MGLLLLTLVSEESFQSRLKWIGWMRAPPSSHRLRRAHTRWCNEIERKNVPSAWTTAMKTQWRALSKERKKKKKMFVWTGSSSFITAWNRRCSNRMIRMMNDERRARASLHSGIHKYVIELLFAKNDYYLHFTVCLQFVHGAFILFYHPIFKVSTENWK